MLNNEYTREFESFWETETAADPVGKHKNDAWRIWNAARQNLNHKYKLAINKVKPEGHDAPCGCRQCIGIERSLEAIDTMDDRTRNEE